MDLPATPSFILQAGFIILSAIVCIWWIWAMARSYAKPQATFNRTVAAKTTLFLLGWTAVLITLSHSDWIHTFEVFPPYGLRFFIALLVISSIIVMSQIGLQLVRTLPIYLLVGFQAFRIPVELLIHQAANAGLAPMEMTYFGRNFDIISGLSAIVLALFLFRRVISAKILLLWNVLAMALLTNVVVVAILSMPHPLQVLNTDPANVWVTYSPFILLPGVLVCSAFFGHLLVFRYLRQFNHNPAFRAESRLC